MSTVDGFPSPPSDSGGSPAVAIVVSLIILVVIIVVSVCCARKMKKAVVSELRAAVAPPMPSNVIQVWEVDAPTMEKFFLELAQEKPVRFTAQQLCAFTNNYSVTLGSGGLAECIKGSSQMG
ncbi:UNVERIFIED_CONTAM: hypothetical protein Slati_0539400 [Sesamum latifolium]|uniref:Uncharacterized protein n=1 Tax=Sesamum latifolium TaxID=2727402 RepID=A0AAW2Y0A5_9LAMI